MRGHGEGDGDAAAMRRRVRVAVGVCVIWGLNPQIRPSPLLVGARCRVPTSLPCVIYRGTRQRTNIGGPCTRFHVGPQVLFAVCKHTAKRCLHTAKRNYRAHM